MGCSSSQESVTLKELDSQARDLTLRFYEHQLENRRSRFRQCESRAHSAHQCRGVVDEEVEGNRYCAPCFLLIKNDKQAYNNHISEVIQHGACEDWQSYVGMIKANIQYVLRKRQLDQQHLQRMGLSDSPHFVSVQLENVGILRDLATIIRDYLDFTPEIMGVRGRVNVSLLHGGQVYRVESDCLAFVYNHTCQCFMGIDGYNCIHFGLLKKMYPTDHPRIQYDDRQMNYCILSRPKDQKEKLDLIEL